MGPHRTAEGGISSRGSRMLRITLAGHRHPATTRRYIEVNEEMIRRAVEVL
jgi:hypothetical protein